MARFSPSALGFFIIFAVTVFGGVEFLAYQNLADRVRDAVMERLESGTQPVALVDQSKVSRWQDVTGVAGLARTLMVLVVRAETPDDNIALERALSKAAEASPTWSPQWQSLAEARLAGGFRIEDVVAAFRMSDLSGSHEGYVMIRRALFGLEHWAALPESDRRTVIKDVLATSAEENSVTKRYHDIVVTKSETERAEIRTSLLKAGLANKKVLQALGV